MQFKFITGTSLDLQASLKECVSLKVHETYEKIQVRVDGKLYEISDEGHNRPVLTCDCVSDARVFGLLMKSLSVLFGGMLKLKELEITSRFWSESSFGEDMRNLVNTPSGMTKLTVSCIDGISPEFFKNVLWLTIGEWTDCSFDASAFMNVRVLVINYAGVLFDEIEYEESRKVYEYVKENFVEKMGMLERIKIPELEFVFTR